MIPLDFMIISNFHKILRMLLETCFLLHHMVFANSTWSKIWESFGKKVTTIYDNASKVYRKSKFKKLMKQLKKILPKAYTYLVEARVESVIVCIFYCSTLWIYDHEHCREYKLMLETCPQVANIYTVKFVRDMVQWWFYDRHDVVACTDTQLTPTTSTYVQRSLDAAQ